MEETNQQLCDHIFGVFDRIAGRVIEIHAADITRRFQKVIADAFSFIEIHDLIVARIYINPIDYADVDVAIGYNIILPHPQPQTSLYKFGATAVCWGAEFISSNFVPAGNVYLCCDLEFLLRTKKFTYYGDDSHVINFNTPENLGDESYNCEGVVKIVIERD